MSFHLLWAERECLREILMTPSQLRLSQVPWLYTNHFPVTVLDTLQLYREHFYCSSGKAAHYRVRHDLPTMKKR